MTSPKTYSYLSNSQPDPEIWSGGAAGGTLLITSGSTQPQNLLIRYVGTGPVLQVYSGTASDYQGYFYYLYIGDIPTYSIFNFGVEHSVYVPPINVTQQSISVVGVSSYKLISSEVSLEESIVYSGTITEKVTYDYNIDSTEEFLSSSNGLISAVIDEYDDYGIILDPTQEHIDCGSTEISSTTVAALGEIQLSNSAIYERISLPNLYVSNISVSSFGTESITYDFDSVVSDIAVIGSATYSAIYNTPEETVNISSTISSIEKRGHSYNDNSILEYSLEDYSTIDGAVTSSVDYGFISITPNQGNEDFGSEFNIDQVTLPFGNITLSGSAIVVSPPGIKTYNTGATYSVSYNPPENIVSLLNFGQKFESRTYDYNDQSVIVVTLDDIGSINDAVTSVIDYGLITEVYVGEDDAGEVSALQTTLPFGGLSINGSANTEWINKNFYGEGEYRVTYSPDNTFGTLFGFGEKLESRTYDYNDQSGVVVTIDDIGSINDAVTSVIDYGLITEAYIGEDDAGSIQSSTTTPFGSISINGSANTEWINKNFYGEGKYKVTYSPDNTFGTLFGFGDKLESRTYDYNDQSGVVVTIDDIGSINDAVTSVIDYGLITEVYVGEDDSGSIQSSTTTPFGNINISGSSQNIVEVQIPENTIISNLSGTLIESILYTPPINISPNNTFTSTEITVDSTIQTFDQNNPPFIKLSGSSDNSPVSYREIGSGTLFEFGEKLESRTYDYNDQSGVVVTIDDIGSINDAVTSVIDYGLITEVYVGEDDSGSIQSSTTTPFGSISINGSANTEWINKNFYGEGKYKVTYSPDNTFGALFGFGEKLESRTYDYNLDSILLLVSEDIGSINDAVTSVIDYGLIAEAYVGEDDNGGISVLQTIPPFGNINIFGSSGNVLVSNEQNTVLFIISGELIPPNIDYTPSITGQGILSINGSSLNSFISNSDIVTAGISTIIVGETVVESRTHSYNESSILTDITPNYGLISSESEVSVDYGSISVSGGEILDYGSIGTGISIIYPYGSIVISGELIPPNIEYIPSYTSGGTLTISGSASYSEIDAFGVGRRRGGTIAFSGFILESDTESYVGLGTLTVSGSALEAYSAQTPEDTQLFIISGSLVEKETDSYVGLGTLTVFGELVHPDIDYTPHYGIDKNIGIGTTGIQLSGSLVEKETDSYVGLGTLTFAASVVESDTESYVGLGTLTLSGSALEVYSAQTPEDLVLYTFSGSLIEKETDSYVGLGTLTVFGELVHPDIDYTPHYGIDKNIGIGTTGIQLSGVARCGKVGFYRGVGIVTVSGSALEAYSLTVPTDTQLFSINGNARTYSPIYPRNSGVVGSATGLIRLNDDAGLTITRATLPYKATGGIFLSGSGPDSFSFSNYDGFGTLDLSGIAPTRQIDVYQDYVTTGSIFISQQTQPIIEKIVNTYIGIGTIVEFGSVSNVRFLSSWFASGTINLGKTLTSNYCGTGDQFSSNTNTFDSTISTLDLFCNDSILVTSSAVVESFSAQTPENTQLFSISGSALEAYSAQTPEDTVLYEFDGDLIESRTYGYNGSGQITFGSAAKPQFRPRIFGVGLFRFTTHLSDSLYDTCDSNRLTSDYQDSALVRFTANPPKSTQLFNVLGSANTQEINVYTQVGIGNVTFSGSLEERQTDSYLGTGILYDLSSGGKIEVDSYNGTGSLFAISGSSQSKSTQTPENALLITVSGTALTKLESEYSYSGISSVYVSGSASTRFEADYPYSGIGTITLSGQVVYPDIQFIPAYKASGLFTFSGISSNSTSRIGVLSGNKTLFAFSGGFESFSRVTYIGIGTAYIETTVGITINNKFQIPRTYVCII
jgi:hypothetical protein